MEIWFAAADFHFPNGGAAWCKSDDSWGRISDCNFSFSLPVCLSALLVKVLNTAGRVPLGNRGLLGLRGGGSACETDHRTSKYISSSTFSLKLFFPFSQE